MAVDVSSESPSGRTALAASDSGGLFETTDGGDSWRHIDSLPPFRLSDVKYAPSDSDIVIVTALADSRTMTLGAPLVSMGGIWRSTDGGDTWEKPTGAEPFISGCSGRTDAFGIAFEPGTDRVYVGTGCGLAVSDDLGASWTHIPVNGSSGYVSSVVVPKQGIIDVCGKGGHFRLDWTDDARPSKGEWQGGNLPRACRSPVKRAPQSLAVSPLDSNTLFAAVQANLTRCRNGKGRRNDGWTRTVFRSTDGGQSWTDLNVPCNGLNREPFVTTPPVASDRMFDIHFGDGVDTWRQTDCTSSGCQAKKGAWNKVEVDHPDQIDIAYPPGSECPKFMANDGGVERTTDCGANWYNVGNATSGYNALQLYEVKGQLVDSSPHTDMYVGTQDNRIWASPDGGGTWSNKVCCEGGFLSLDRRVPDHDASLITGVAIGARGNFKSDPHFESVTDWNDPPGATPNVGQPKFVEQGVYLQWGNLSNGSLWITNDSGDSWTNVVTGDSWTDVVNLPEPLGGLGIFVSGPPADPTVYAIANRSGNRIGLVKITNVRGPGDARITDADTGLNLATHSRGSGTFAVPKIIAVDPNTPDHLLAADFDDRVMNVSTDGGGAWSQDLELSRYVVHDGEYESSDALGPKRSDTYRFIWNPAPRRQCCSQVSTIAFDPTDSDRILVGTEANGIIASVDGGETWGRVPGSRQIPVITSFFFDSRRGQIYISSYGRGLWVLDEEDLTPLRQIQGQTRVGPAEARTSIVDPDRFDSGLPNDAFRTSTGLNQFEEHTHIENEEAAETLGWIGEDREVWSWGTDNQTLHDPTDVDFFNLTLPDPEADQAEHDGFPECTTREVDPDEIPLPARFIDGGTLVIDSRLAVIQRSRVPLSGAAPSDDGAIAYEADSRNQVDSFLKCPRSEHGVTEIVVSYGERPEPDRTVFPEYDIGMTYRIDIQFLPKPAEWMLGEIEAESGRASGIFPCGKGIFPHSCDAQGSFGFRHPQSPFPGPECQADGPGCPMFWGFHWQTEHTLDMTFTSNTDLEYELLDASGQPIARAREEPQLFAIDPGPSPDGISPKKRFFYAVKSPGSQTSLAAIAQDEDSKITKRLTVSDLEPGFYVLRVNGTEADVSVRFDPPPPPPDSDGDGTSDYFDADVSARGGSLDFNDQVLDTNGAVTVEDLSTGQPSTLVVTYTDSGAEIVVGVASANNLDDQDVPVTIEDAGGFPGEHTAWVFDDDDLQGLPLEPGDDILAATGLNPSGVQDLALDFESAQITFRPIDDFENPPTDLDGDGKFEDVNGDGGVNVGDVQALFANSQDPVVQTNVAAFDFNDDGGVNVGDVQALFAKGVGV